MTRQSDRRVKESAVWIDRRQSNRRIAEGLTELNRAVQSQVREHDASPVIAKATKEK